MHVRWLSKLFIPASRRGGLGSPVGEAARVRQPVWEASRSSWAAAPMLGTFASDVLGLRRSAAVILRRCLVGVVSVLVLSVSVGVAAISAAPSAAPVVTICNEHRAAGSARRHWTVPVWARQIRRRTPAG